MTDALDRQSLGDSLEFDADRWDLQRSHKIRTMWRDRDAGAGVPDDGISVGRVAVVPGRRQRQQGGSKGLSRGEDPIREVCLSHVGFVSRGGQGIKLGKGKSRRCGAAIFGKGVATESFSLFVTMIHR